MTERLSDDDLKDIVSDDDAWPSCAEAHEMAREIIDLRSRIVELDAAASNATGEALTLRAKLAEWPWSLDAGLSWSGFGISGDTRSIAEVKRLISVEGRAEALHRIVIEQSAQLAAGPVMPEVPSDDVLLSGLYAFWERQEHGKGEAFGKSEIADMGRALSAIRAELLKEQA